MHDGRRYEGVGPLTFRGFSIVTEWTAGFAPVDSQINLADNCLRSHSRWLRDLRRWSAATRLQGLRVRIPPRTWRSVCCECCVLSGRGLCDRPITRPEESYRV